MKKVLKLFFILFWFGLFFANSANAQIFEYINKTAAKNETVEETAYQESSVNVFLSYEQTPKKVYVGEVFPVVLKAIITSDYDAIVTKIADNNFEFLNKNNVWAKTDNPQILNTTIYLKAKKKVDEISGFEIGLIKNDELIETATIGSIEIESVKLNADRNFSGVLAKNFNTVSSFANRFDENSIALTANFEATDSNLKDFNVTLVEKSRVDILDEYNFERQTVQYSAILPNYQESFEFTYFDTSKNSFEFVKIPLILKSDDVSTHIDINPKENVFNFYKDLFLAILAIILIVIFIIKRYKITIILAVIILIFLAYNNNPFNDIKIEQDTNVHILPNEKLTILYKTESVTNAEQLDEKNGFVKVLLPNEKIGWVKKERVIKN